MPHPNGKYIVRHPLTGTPVALNLAENYADDHELVRTYPWAFAVPENVGEIIESVSVEQATAGPGEKRSRTRAKK